MGRKQTSIGIGILALAVGLLAAVAATSAGAFGGHCGHGGPPRAGRLERRLERQGLSPDVRAKAFAILHASRRDERAPREKSRAAPGPLPAPPRTGAPPPPAPHAP